jgi:hypothetical protein
MRTLDDIAPGKQNRKTNRLDGAPRFLPSRRNVGVIAQGKDESVFIKYRIFPGSLQRG